MLRVRRRSRAERLNGSGSGKWSDRVLAATHEGICGVDLAGVATFVNPAAARIIGLPSDTILGSQLTSVLALLVPSDEELNEKKGSAAARCLEAALADGTEHDVDDTFVRADGSVLPVHVVVRPVFEADALVGVVVLLSDNTEHQQAVSYYGEVVRLTEQEAAQREIVHQLQEAVRPPHPDADSVDLAVHYLPADPALPTGGDLYDWQALPTGDLHIAVVDVLGKGVPATKNALAVVHAMRLLVLEGCPMDRVVRRADELLRAHNPELVATVLVARYEPRTGRLQLAGAGHPPALVVSPDGGVREVAAPGIAIGWPNAGSFDVVSVEMDRGDTLILYTDGLVEARRDIVQGLDDLKDAAAQTASYPARHLPRILVDRALAGAERRDDTLALVLRRRVAPLAPAGPTLGPFEHRFSPSLAAIPVARHLFADWLRHQPIDGSDREDLLVVASELCTNAVRAATGAPRGCTLRGLQDGAALVIEVADDGEGFGLPVPAADDIPDPERTSGRGLFLVQSMVDDLSVRREEGGTVVRCVKEHVFPH